MKFTSVLIFSLMTLVPTLASAQTKVAVNVNANGAWLGWNIQGLKVPTDYNEKCQAPRNLNFGSCRIFLYPGAHTFFFANSGGIGLDLSEDGSLTYRDPEIAKVDPLQLNTKYISFRTTSARGERATSENPRIKLNFKNYSGSWEIGEYLVSPAPIPLRQNNGLDKNGLGKLITNSDKFVMGSTLWLYLGDQNCSRTDIKIGLDGNLTFEDGGVSDLVTLRNRNKTKIITIKPDFECPRVLEEDIKPSD